MRAGGHWQEVCRVSLAARVCACWRSKNWAWAVGGLAKGPSTFGQMPGSRWAGTVTEYFWVGAPAGPHGSWLGTRLRQMSAPAQVPARPRRQPRFSAKVSLDIRVAGRVRLRPGLGAESFRAGTDPEDGAGSFAAEVAEGDVALVALVTLRPAAAADPPPPRCHSRSSRTLYRSTTRLAPASNRKGRCRKLRCRPAFSEM